MDVISVDGMRTRVHRTGAGRSLVYLHSIFGEIGALPFFDELSRSGGLEVFAPELPGFGGSDPLPDRQTLADVVFRLRRVLDEAGLREFTLMGSSLGGWLAAEMAVWFPDRVSSLVLVGAFGLEVEGHAVFDLFGSSHHELWARAFPDGGDLLAYLDPVLVESPDGSDAVRLHLFRSMEATARIGWNPYLHDPKLSSRLTALRVPTLVVWGEADGVVPLAHGRAYARHIPGAGLEVVSAAGHVPVLDRTTETAAAVAEFLKAEVRLG